MEMFTKTYQKYSARQSGCASLQWEKKWQEGCYEAPNKKNTSAKDLTWGFLLDTASVWRSRQWPTSWSPHQCGTAFPSCPTRRGWAWLQCGSETTLQSQLLYTRLCRKNTHIHAAHTDSQQACAQLYTGTHLLKNAHNPNAPMTHTQFIHKFTFWHRLTP